MTDQTSASKIKSISPQLGTTMLFVETGSSVVAAADTIVITLGSHGMKKLKAVDEFIHNSFESAVHKISDANHAVTAVSSGVLTITLGTGTGARTFLIVGE